MKHLMLLVVCIHLAVCPPASAGDAKSASTDAASSAKPQTFVRTENYPRPPYSGATYYIYERNGQTICTKLEVCNKYDHCETSYTKGTYRDDEDVQTGAPYGTTPAVAIPAEKLNKHVCLVKFHLN